MERENSGINTIIDKKSMIEMKTMDKKQLILPPIENKSGAAIRAILNDDNESDNSSVLSSSTRRNSSVMQ